MQRLVCRLRLDGLLRPAARRYGTSSGSTGAGDAGSAGSADAAGRRRRPLPSPLSLEHFLQRARALALYRRIVRGTRPISDPATRAETRRFARDEFERHRGVTDLTHIRYLISTGATEWEHTERLIVGL